MPFRIIHQHHHHHHSDPEILRRLDRIDEALTIIRKDVSNMTKVTDKALSEIEASVTNVTGVVDAIKAYIEANVTAQDTLNAELEAEGVDVTRLTAFNDALRANTDRLAAMIVKGTPADTGAPVPPVVPTS
jgi:hypothetical protein